MESKILKPRVIVLFCILIFGLSLRIYHLNFPAIGYHNMKENEYLSMAQEMKNTGDILTRRIYFYNGFDTEPIMRLFPQPPLVTYQVLFSWKILGQNLWGARLFNVLFGVLSIFIIYLIAKLLFKDIRLALFCAFLLAGMPLAVFFSRNLQPESPAFLFLLFGSLFYLKFISSLKKKFLFLGGIAFSCAWIYKFNFLIGIVPLIFCLPFKKIFSKSSHELLRYLGVVCLSYSLILITYVLLRYLGQWEFGHVDTLGRIKIFEVFTYNYWFKYGKIILSYAVHENYTWIFGLLSLCGVIIALIKRKGLINRFVIGWIVSLIIYFMIFSDFLNQHNYYQMPFLLPVCICAVYAVCVVSDFLEGLFHKKVLVCLITVIIILAAIPSYRAIVAMYRVVFWGCDVAGDTIKNNTLRNERFFLLAYCQADGIATYAQRYAGWTNILKDFKENEAKYNIRYICVYPFEYLELLNQHPDILNYIQANYHLKEIGVLRNTSALIYLILEKGCGENIKERLLSLRGDIKITKTYDVAGKRFFFDAVTVQAGKNK